MKITEIDLKDVQLHWQEVMPGCPGASAVCAVHHSYPMPIATVWFRHVGGQEIDILSCYTVQYYRRQGVLRRCIKQLQEWWPKRTIVTGACNELSAPAFRKMGFIRTKKGWFLNA